MPTPSRRVELLIIMAALLTLAESLPFSTIGHTVPSFDFRTASRLPAWSHCTFHDRRENRAEMFSYGHPHVCSKGRDGLFNRYGYPLGTAWRRPGGGLESIECVHGSHNTRQHSSRGGTKVYKHEAWGL